MPNVKKCTNRYALVLKIFALISIILDLEIQRQYLKVLFD